MLFLTYLDVTQVAANECLGADDGRVLNDSSVDIRLDDLNRVMIPLFKLGRELGKWLDEVEELIDNEFEFATSPFASKTDAATNQSEPS